MAAAWIILAPSVALLLGYCLGRHAGYSAGLLDGFERARKIVEEESK